MPDKPVITVTSFRAFERNTLVGFCNVEVGLGALRLELRDLTLHSKSGRRWVSFPAKPQLDSTGNQVTLDNGKPAWNPFIAWPIGIDSAIRERFNTVVWEQAEQLMQPATPDNDESENDPEIPF